MANKFKDHVVWITGASSGIGAALAAEFIKEGAIVALSARRENRLYSLSEKLGPQAHVFTLDVQNKAAVDQVAHRIAEKLGKIDAVVANAGYSTVGSLESLSEEVWRQQFDTNVFGVVWTLQAALPYLRQTQGRIGIVSSVVGKIALANNAAYSASKFALTAIANALYQELYSSGISVTNIAPGWVDSEIWQVNNLGQPRENRMDINTFGLRWPSDKAARVMLNALYLRKREEIVTGHGKLVAFLGTHCAPVTYWSLAKASKAAGMSPQA
jgi:NADP-dependent 3-hydroxy acid dehydrogenase YdfG